MWITVWNRRMPVDNARLVLEAMHKTHGVLWNSTKIALFTQDGELRLEVDSECEETRAAALKVAEDLDGYRLA